MLIEAAKFQTRQWLASAIAATAAFFLAMPIAKAQSPGAQAPRPNLESNIDRPLRYRPDGADFVIENGEESFNRSLYGRNTAFRVDGGDKPEFVLYLPGRGGNLRLGIRDAAQARWLMDAAAITTRYRPGELRYEIRDPLLGSQGVLHLHVLALHESDGLVLRAWYTPGPAPRQDLELIVAFGGVNGERGVRDGDIGTERVPIREWFQLRPEFCAGNSIALRPGGFELRSAAAHILGVFPGDATLSIGSGAHWQDIAQLLADRSVASLPVLVGRMRLRPGAMRHLALQRIAGGAAGELATYREVTVGEVPPPGASVPLAPRLAPGELRRHFDTAREHFRELRERVLVRTPDPFIDAAVGALNIAADAVWDEPQNVVMHGAIAWRARLLGWRGAYAMDALGWHERARQHFEYWATRQNLSPIPAQLPPAEEATHLARNPAGLHSNGDLANSHYDMNLVYVDAVFRHLLWTGDLEFARRMWPVIERHLAWERRLFRREFGPQKLPLYEAYAAIWASDDLQYHGGGVTHASAYNWWHNVMAARAAQLLGHDATPYSREAELISRAMYEYLWLPEQGMFAEYRDYLGLQRAHPAAALWSFYHALDAPGLVDTARAWRMTRWVTATLPQIPVRGPGIEGGHHVLATSNWMPYTWSINNVVMGENMHAALGFWRAGEFAEAFTLFRSALLASMYMGISPGNVGTMNYLDVYRRESQRDFADGSGTMSRALIEGLFGVRPDALTGELTLEPGWPQNWEHATLRSPSLSLEFRREEHRDRYRVTENLPAINRVRLRLRLRGTQMKVLLAGRAVQPVMTSDALGRKYIEISWPTKGSHEIVIEWQGPVPEKPEKPEWPAPPIVAQPSSARAHGAPAGGYAPVDLQPFFNERVVDIFQPGKYRSPRSPFVSLAMPAQGIGSWAGHVNASAPIDDAGLRRVASEHRGRFTLPDGVPFVIPVDGTARNVVFTSQWDNYPDRVSVPLSGRAQRLVLLMAGSTNHMQSRFDNGEVIVEYLDGSSERLALHNPTNWWPIDQDYFVDDFQFRRPEDIPTRIDLKTGQVRAGQPGTFRGRGGPIPGGSATVLELSLDSRKELRALRVGALANEVVVGLMAATLVR
jgi:hypothetical protein